MPTDESIIITEEQIPNIEREHTHTTGSIVQESEPYGDSVGGDKVSGDKVGGDKIAGDKNESQFFISYHVQMADKSSETTRAIKVELTSEQERRIRPEVIQSLVNQLQQNQLLVINDHLQMDKQEIVDHVIWGFQRSYQKMPVWLWSEDDEDVEELNLADFLALQNDQVSKPGIFIFREVFHSDFARTDWSYLQSALKKRQQYLILTPSIPLAKWQDSRDVNAFQADIPENVFDPVYLVEELQTALINVNVDELPQIIAQNIQTPNLISDLTLHDVARALNSPTNIHVFVARLRYFGNEMGKDEVTKLIAEVHQQQNSEKIYYLYKQLGTDQHKLLAAALCLFGDLDETRAFLGLKRVIQGPWRQMFPAIGIFDYFHIDPLYFLWDRQDNRIVHRQPNQRRSLLKFTWQSYQYHICEALPHLVPLVADSVQPRSRPKTEAERQRDQALRITISEVLGDVGRLSVSAVENTLLQLASHTNSGVQVTAARAMAQWAGQSRELEVQLFDMLQRWQRNQWQQIAEFSIDSKSIQLTVVRTVYYILLEMPSTLLPKAMPGILWGLFFNQYQEVRKYFSDNLRSKLFPQYLEQITPDWTERLPYQSSNATPEYWVNSLVTFGYICDQYGQFDSVAPWLIKGLVRSAHGEDPVSESLTEEQRQWLGQKVFPLYLRQLQQLLLTLLQKNNSGSEMVDVFVLAYQIQPQDVLQLLSNWRDRWQRTVEKQDEALTASWVIALPTIGMIYGAINEFQSFMPWLTIWLERCTWQQYTEVVSTLVQIHQYQTATQSLSLPLAASDPTVVTRGSGIKPLTHVEKCLYNWFIDSKTGQAQQQVALLFWSELQETGIAKKCAKSDLPKISGIAHLMIWLLIPNHQSTIHNLFPVAQRVHQVSAGTMNLVIKQLRIAPPPKVNSIGTSLGYMLRIANAGCFFALLVAPMRLLATVVRQIYPLVWKLVKWLWANTKP